MQTDSGDELSGKSVVFRWWPILLLALLPLIPLWRCIFLGEAVGPFDQIRHMAPWNGPKPIQPWDVLQADGVLQFYPWRDMVFKAWAHGQLPLWNNYELAGTPLLANSQSAGFYPLHVAIGLLHIATAPAMVMLAWFHLFWAGLGTYVLAKRFGASGVGAALGAAAFELSPFMLAWTALPSVISTVSWIPWLLVGVYGVVDAARARSVAVCAALVAMMLLAGHLQFAAYGLFAGVLLGILLSLGRSGWRGLLWLAAAFVWGGLLAAPQLLPVMAYSQSSHRRNTPTTEGYKAYLTGAIKPFELANLSVATSLGDPRESVEVRPGVNIASYWPGRVKPGANFSESAVTLGPIVLGLLVLVDYRDRRLWPLLTLLVLALLLALGTILNWPLYFLAPGWSSTGSPGRAIVLSVMAACVLAATAVRDIKPQRLAVAVCGAIALSAVFSYGAPYLAPSQTATSLGALAEPAPHHVFVVAIVIATLALLPLVNGLDRYRSAIIAGPILLATVGYALTLVSTGMPIQIESTHGFDRAAIVNEPWSMAVAAPAYAPPNTAYLLGIHELGGYDSLIDRETVALLKDIDGQDPPPPANGNMMFVKPTADAQKLAAAGVTRLIHRADMGGPGDVKINGPGRASIDGRPCEIVEETPQRLTVKVAGPGHLIVRDRNMPGWMAKVDASHVPFGGKVWRELDLPSGSHTVEFNYVPPGLMPGVYLGAVGWLLVLFALAALRTKPTSLR